MPLFYFIFHAAGLHKQNTLQITHFCINLLLSLLLYNEKNRNFKGGVWGEGVCHPLPLPQRQPQLQG